MSKREEKDTKNRRVDIRMTGEEYSDLRYMAFETGKSQSDVIRDALKMYKNIVKNT